MMVFMISDVPRKLSREQGLGGLLCGDDVLLSSMQVRQCPDERPQRADQILRAG
jgi:hypothetical protein